MLCGTASSAQLFDDLEGGAGVEWEGGNVCSCIADSL